MFVRQETADFKFSTDRRAGRPEHPYASVKPGKTKKHGTSSRLKDSASLPQLDQKSNISNRASFVDVKPSYQKEKTVVSPNKTINQLKSTRSVQTPPLLSEKNSRNNTPVKRLISPTARVLSPFSRQLSPALKQGSLISKNNTAASRKVQVVIPEFFVPIEQDAPQLSAAISPKKNQNRDIRITSRKSSFQTTLQKLTPVELEEKVAIETIAQAFGSQIGDFICSKTHSTLLKRKAHDSTGFALFDRQLSRSFLTYSHALKTTVAKRARRAVVDNPLRVHLAERPPVNLAAVGKSVLGSR